MKTYTFIVQKFCKDTDKDGAAFKERVLIQAETDAEAWAIIRRKRQYKNLQIEMHNAKKS